MLRGALHVDRAGRTRRFPATAVVYERKEWGSMTKRLLSSLVIASLVLAIGANAVFAGSVNLTGSLSPGGPTGSQVAIISTPTCTGAYTVFAALYAVYSFTVDAGGMYSFKETGSNSAMYVYDGGFDPDFPADNCVAASNTNPLDFTATLAPGTLYHVVVIDDTFAQAGLTYDITIDGPGNITNCIFGDDFEDGIVDWLVVNPDATEAGGNLVLTPSTSKKLEAVATSVYPGCSTCSISSIVQTTGGSRSKLWILGWYTDKKNYVELLLNEPKDIVVLKQRAGGRIVGRQKASLTIDPDTAYGLSMGFDGAQITVSIDGAPLINVSTTRAPTGVPGFRTKRAKATVEYVCVN